MVEANPFQPPSAPTAPPPDVIRDALTPDEIAEARRRLAEHCAHPRALERDRALEGGRFARTTAVAWGTAVIGGVAFGLGALEALGDEAVQFVAIFVGGLVAIVAALVGLASLYTDLRVGRRSAATDPRRALSRWFLAARGGKHGYTFVALAPTARGWTVTPPAYGPEDQPRPSIVLDSPDAMKTYLRSFARPGAGFVRWFQPRQVRVVREDADLAVVRAELRLTKWPQWANVLSLVLFLLLRLLGLIIALVLYFALRKTTKLHVEKTLLRGSDGLWYLLDADLRR